MAALGKHQFKYLNRIQGLPFSPSFCFYATYVLNSAELKVLAGVSNE